jgi:phage FluMu protein Com
MNKKIKYLKDLLSFLEYHNRMAPFPMYDTEYVSTIRKQLEKMDEKINYDSLPTVACRHCNSLGLFVDDVDNDICMRCGSINEITIFPDYYSYDLYVTSQLHEDY